MSAPAPSRGYWLGLGAVAASLVALALWAAWREWFSRDDFHFLAYVQLTDPWSWRQVFLPLEERSWTFYRPLSMETYFRVNYGLFGLDAFGFFAVSLGLHFLGSLLVYRVARSLDFGVRVAAATALLAVSRHGSLDEIYYGSVFMYVGEVFLVLLAMTSFLAHLRRGRPLPQLASCLALALAFLCNEHAVTTLLLLAWVALGSGEATLADGGWRRLLRSLAPQTVLTFLYLLFRFRWLAPLDAPALYSPQLGTHVPGNTLQLVASVFGGALAAWIALALAAGLLAAVLTHGDVALRRWLFRAGGACLAWLVTAAAPFALLPFPQGRWAMPLAVPVALGFGSLLEALDRSLGLRRPRAFEAALLALVLVSMPLGALWSHVQAPRGDAPRRILQWIDAQQPPLSDRAVVVVLFGVPGLASPDAAERFRYYAYGGGVLNAAYPDTQRVMRFVDLSRRLPRNALRPDSVYLALGPDLSLDRAAPALLDRELPRRFDVSP